jgi:hypothetical protein
VFNATVVPSGTLTYLTLWPQGAAQQIRARRAAGPPHGGERPHRSFHAAAIVGKSVDRAAFGRLKTRLTAAPGGGGGSPAPRR